MKKSIKKTLVTQKKIVNLPPSAKTTKAVSYQTEEVFSPALAEEIYTQIEAEVDEENTAKPEVKVFASQGADECFGFILKTNGFDTAFKPRRRVKARSESGAPSGSISESRLVKPLEPNPCNRDV